METSSSKSENIVNVTLVESLKEVNEEIRRHELSNSTKYVTIKKEKLYGKEDIDVSTLLNSDIRFEDTKQTNCPYIAYDGIPFIIIGKKILACHHGRDLHHREKQRNKEKDAEVRDHDYRKRRKILQTTKKKDCAAGIRIRHVLRFPDFKVSERGKRSEKDQQSFAIKLQLKGGHAIKKVHMFYISFPDDSEHSNHFMGEDASLIQPIDEALKKYIGLMVSQHLVSNTFQMKLLLEVYVKQTLFKGENIPSRLNKRFWPSVKDIKNHMALALLRLRNTNVDQAVVLELVNGWKKEYPKDEFFIRIKEGDEETYNNDLPSCPESDSVPIEEEVVLDGSTLMSVSVSNKKFLFVHQTDFQKSLLKRYGHEICLMDATYRTTRYAVPLYFICVPTNVNYMTIATFITETEDNESLIEALTVLRNWNPEWNPSFFMCDYATEEIKSIETVFPDCFVYLCDFHREQAWERWMTASHNGMQNTKIQALGMLRNVAAAATEDEFLDAKEKLQESAVWKENKNLRDWFERYWLSKSDRWVQAYRSNRFNVSINTNNGIERQNLALKYEYLQSRKAPSLSHLLTIIIDSFNFWSYRKYRQLNIQASDQARKYSDQIPGFMANRPPELVKYWFTRWQEAENIPAEDIQEVDDTGTFIVRSQSSQDNMDVPVHYMVKFQRNNIGLPYCDCKDWNRSHLLCKHFFAIFQHFGSWDWESLPKAYRDSPFLNLDIENVEHQVHVEHQVTDVPTEIFGNETCENTEIQECNFVELPVTSAASLKRSKQKCQSLCDEIKDLCHMVKDIETLVATIEGLVNLKDKITSSIPQTKEFLLDNNNMLNIGTTPKKTTKCSKLKKLKPKRKGVGRVGRKAAQQRKSYINIGANDMMKKDREPSQENATVTVENDLEYDQTAKPSDVKVDTSIDQDIDMGENNEDNKKSNLLKEFKDYSTNISSIEWNDLQQNAMKSYRNSLDMTTQIGYAVISNELDVGDNNDGDDDLVASFMLQMTALMPKELQAMVKHRLVHIVLEKMVNEQIISLRRDGDPRVRAKERTEALDTLLNDPVFISMRKAIHGQNIRKTSLHQAVVKPKKVVISEEAIKFKQNKLHQLQMSSPIYPGGGLMNTAGNNLCFANALLQCLRIADLHKLMQYHVKCKVTQTCFTCCLKEFLKDPPVSAEPVCRQMTSFWPQYRVGVQQDSHELLQKIMNEVQQNCFSTEIQEMAEMKKIFYGQIEYSWRCDICKSESKKLQQFFDISLSITKYQTVTQAVEGFFLQEKVEKMCSSCTKNTPTTLKKKLVEIPKNIIIQLQRFNCAQRKVMKKLDLHFDIFLRSYVLENKVLEDKAQLFAVIVHKGASLGNGHYFAFIKFGGQWYRVDDMKIQQVSVLSLNNMDGQAYLLFYRALPRPYIT